jgi:hypothetical protein
MKLTDLGTTGLVDYVLAKQADPALIGRRANGSLTAACNVIRARHGAEGVCRFRQAIACTRELRRQTSSRLSPNPP